MKTEPTSHLITSSEFINPYKKRPPTTQRKMRLGIFIILALFLSACRSPVEYIEPALDNAYSEIPDFHFSYPITNVETNLSIVLNKTDVTNIVDWAMSEEGGHIHWRAPAEQLRPYIIEGENNLEVVVYDFNDPSQGYFTIDTKAPEIVVLSSSAHDETANPVKIFGVSLDSAGTKSLSINNRAIPIPALSRENKNRYLPFEIEVPRSDLYNFVAEDELSHSATRQFADLYNIHNDAFSVRLNESGLSDLSELAKRLLNDLDVLRASGETFWGIPVIYTFESSSTGPLGGVWNAQGFVYDLNMHISDIDLAVSGSNKLRLQATLAAFNMAMAVDINTPNGILDTDFPIYGLGGDIDVTADVTINVENGEPTVSVTNLDFTIPPLAVWIPFDAIDTFVDVFSVFSANYLINRFKFGMDAFLNGNKFENLIKDELNSAIGDAVVTLTEDLNKGIDVPINGFAELSFHFALEDIRTSNGGLSLDVSGGILPSRQFINDKYVPQPLGPIYVSDALPSADQFSSQDFGVTVNANLLNQALTAAHSVGLTQITLAEGNVYAGLPADNTNINKELAESPSGFDGYFYDHLTGYLEETESYLFGLIQITRQIPQYESAYLPDQSPRHPAIGGIGTTRLLVDNHVPAKLEVIERDGNNGLMLSLYNISIAAQEKIRAYNPSNPDAEVYRTNFATTLNVKAPITVNVRADNKFDIVVSEDMILELANFTIAGTSYMPDENVVVEYITTEVNRQIKSASYALLDVLKEPLEGIEIPTFYCMSLSLDQVTSVGNNKGHLGVTANMSPLPNNQNCAN